MLELKAYRTYNSEKKIAIMDNSFLSFLEKLGKQGFQTDVFLQDYDLILIPDWVLEEVKDSPFRRDFVQNLINSGFPVFSVSELDYTDFVYQEELNLYEIVLASVRCIFDIQKYLQKNVKTKDPLDMEPYRKWVADLSANWPLQGKITSSGRAKKKNAGEISITILAEIFSWYYPDIESITIQSSDMDAYDFVEKANEGLRKYFSKRIPVPIAFKSEDSLLCQMLRSGMLKTEDLAVLRPNPRYLQYMKIQSDGAVAAVNKRVDNGEFLSMVRDLSIHIVF